MCVYLGLQKQGPTLVGCNLVYDEGERGQREGPLRQEEDYPLRLADLVLGGHSPVRRGVSPQAGQAQSSFTSGTRAYQNRTTSVRVEYMYGRLNTRSAG